MIIVQFAALLEIAGIGIVAAALGDARFLW
jgi:hypothetical protein